MEYLGLGLNSGFLHKEGKHGEFKNMKRTYPITDIGVAHISVTNLSAVSAISFLIL